MMMAVWQRSANGVLGATSAHAHVVLRPLSFGAGQARPAPLNEDEEFRVLSFTKKRVQMKRPVAKRDIVPPPRTQQMAIDQVYHRSPMAIVFLQYSKVLNLVFSIGPVYGLDLDLFIPALCRSRFVKGIL